MAETCNGPPWGASIRKECYSGSHRDLFSGDENRRQYPERKRTGVDDRLKELMQELGNAINESLSDSERIAAAIGEIKRAGYDVFLVLEATIGFNKREDGEEESELVSDAPPQFETAGKIKWTSQDHKFLRALKISLDEESH